VLDKAKDLSVDVLGAHGTSVSGSGSTFRICPRSIKNKSSMSSWQASSRQSARQDQQAEDRQASINFQHSSQIDMNTNHQQKHLLHHDNRHLRLVAVSPAINPCSSSDVLNTRSESPSVAHARTSCASPSKRIDMMDMQKKASPAKRSTRKKVSSPVKKKASPMLEDKDDKENASVLLGSCAFDRVDLAGVESTEQSADQENEEGLDSSLMMP